MESGDSLDWSVIFGPGNLIDQDHTCRNACWPKQPRGSCASRSQRLVKAVLLGRIGKFHLFARENADFLIVSCRALRTIAAHEF